jgi:hypothetical protein
MQKKQSKQNRGGPRRGQVGISHPPPIRDYSITHERRLRYSSGGYDGNITFQNLLDTLLAVTSAITAADLFSSVRIKAVEVWFLPVLGNAGSVSVVFDGATAGSIGDQQIWTDTSMGIQPAHVKARPAPRSGAALFQESSAANAFYLNAPSGAVVDVHLSFRQNMLGGAVAAQNAVVGGTTGAVVTRGLDGLAAASSKFAAPGNNIAQV